MERINFPAYFRRKSCIGRIAASFLSLTILAVSMPDISAYAQTGAEPGASPTENIAADIIISSEDELLEFAKNCENQGFTEGKTAALVSDLDLSGTAFLSIPLFCGIFQGNGHTVRGLELLQPGSSLGFFRYIEAGAVVEDLHIEGEICPGGSRERIGGIAGTNRGTIRNCTFSGKAEALQSLGGIVGFNEESGVVESCTNHAALTGNRQVGGIAGENEGSIRASFNDGEINTSGDGISDKSSVSEPISISMDLEEERDELRQKLRLEKVNAIGGIAGISSGSIEGCTNSGHVGYNRVGYNIGGIAGRHSGLLARCQNSGEITGRKDVGGIVGQLEPYLLVEYEEATTFDDISDIIDTLLDTKDSMLDEIQGTSDSTSDSIDRIDRILSQIKEFARSQKATQRQNSLAFDDEAGKKLDDIDTILANIELDLGSRDADRAERDLRGNVNDLRENIAELQEMLDGLGDSDLILDEENPMSNLALFLQTHMQALMQLELLADEMLGNADELVSKRIEGIEDGIEDFGDQLDGLRIAVKDFLDLTRDYKDQTFDLLDGTDDSVTVQLDRLYDEMDSLSDILRAGRDQVRGERTRIDEELDDLQSTIEDGQDRLKERRDEIFDEDKDLFEDVSEENADSVTAAIIGCSNTGAISSDYQGGGIAGTIGVEIEFDPEKDIESYGDESIYVTRSAMASVRECRNDGDITVQNDYAGGIAGAAWLGALNDNQNYGDIKTVDGDYAGGIAGSSRAAVRGSYSMCEITGNDYAGGIAGSGRSLIGNCAMVNIVSDGGERHGSIAGDREDEEEIHGNFYVEDGLGAVDGITWQAEAEGLPYEAFCQREGIPAEFSSMTVTFLVDGQPFCQLACSYGQAIPMEDIPAAPKKEGFFEKWEEVDLSNIRKNYKVHAQYFPWTNTIASDDSPMPQLLAEAAFMPGADLVVHELPSKEWENQSLEAPKGYQIVGAYDYAVSDPDNESPPQAVRLHALAKGADAVGLLENGVIRDTQAAKDRQYQIFDAPAAGQYVLLKSEPIWGKLAVGAAFLALLIMLLCKRKRPKPLTTL